MKRALTSIVVIVSLSRVSAAFASFHFTQSRVVPVQSIATIVISLQQVNSHDGHAKNARIISASAGEGAISLADVVGIVLFFAVLTVLFVLCRKGVFPETSCLCEPPAWLRRVFTRSRRRADA